MTIQELIDELTDYDPEMEIKAESTAGERFEISHLWQWDNHGDMESLNSHITIELIKEG